MKALKQGQRLSAARDRGKNKFEEMSATQQQVVEDFDTGKCRKQYGEACAKKMPHFSGKTNCELSVVG